MNPRIRSHLDALYGPAAAACAAQLAIRLDQFRAETGAQISELRATGLTERDALLITYADQVREEGVAPLACTTDERPFSLSAARVLTSVLPT